MTQSASYRGLQEALGEPAPNRGPVDLLVEATRLKFSDAEIAELKRLYAITDKTPLGKTPQNDA